jgi:hypothetical protein
VEESGRSGGRNLGFAEKGDRLDLRRGGGKSHGSSRALRARAKRQKRKSGRRTEARLKLGWCLEGRVGFMGRYREERREVSWAPGKKKFGWAGKDPPGPSPFKMNFLFLFPFFPFSVFF